MSQKTTVYGDLTATFDGKSTIIRFDGDQIANCNRNVTAKRFLADLAMYKAEASLVVTKLARILGYLDFCYDENIAPTAKDYEKRKLMEAIR